MSDRPEHDAVKRTCRWCGRKFWARKGEARRRGCPECEPPLELTAQAPRLEPEAAKR